MQWRAFVNRNNLEGQEIVLEEVIKCINRFLMPVCAAMYQQNSFAARWINGGHWVE
jgi:hypothetical protein